MIFTFCLSLLHFSAIFQFGRWKNVQKETEGLSGDHDLLELAEKVPLMYLNSRAESTRRCYKYAFEKWCKWCVFHKLPSFPATEFHVSLYLIHLSDLCKSTSTINEAFYSLSWAHKLAGVLNPCTSEFVLSVKEGVIRTVGHSVHKKEPMTPDILKQIVNNYGKDTSNLKDLRLATMCLICYAGFLRFSELVNLKRSNVKFYADHVNLYIEKSKTDVYREGKDVVISATKNPTCPVAMLSRYLVLANIPEGSNAYIFRSISYCSKTSTYKLRKSGNLSYTTARDILLSALQKLGLDKSKFCLHSLRSGGATAAASAGVEDRLFKKHGRWKSDSAKDGYVKETLSNRMSVSKQLGL